MKAAFLQYNPAFLQIEQNLARVEAMLEGVEADLVVLPELFASGYFFRDREEVVRVAETVPDGPTAQKLLEWAQKSDAVFVGGLPERAGDQLFNSAVIARKKKSLAPTEKSTCSTKKSSTSRQGM